MAYAELMTDGKRQMQVCNSCRYCEGYCAVWHAIEHRREFTDKDMVYLANLCHDCRECFFACPFATPHEFGINPPKLFSGIREESYKKYAIASPLGKLNFWVVTVIALVVLVLFASVTHGFSAIFHRHLGTGAFYQVLSESMLTVIFMILGLWMVVSWITGAARYWRDIKSPKSEKVQLVDVKEAIAYAAKLKYLDKGSVEEKLPASRKWLHHFVFYGFLLDLASTTLGAIYSHVLNIQAPYPVYNPVVILGVLGGIGIIIGAGGLIYVKTKPSQQPTMKKLLNPAVHFRFPCLSLR